MSCSVCTSKAPFTHPTSVVAGVECGNTRLAVVTIRMEEASLGWPGGVVMSDAIEMLRGEGGVEMIEVGNSP